MRIVVATSALVLSACLASPSTECFAVPSAAALRGGGWDANGTSLGGGGGWDYNGRTLGAEDEALDVVDGAGATVRVDRGWLVDAADAPIAVGRVVLRGARSGETPIDVRLERTDAGVPLYDARTGGIALCDGLAAFVPGSFSRSGAHVDDGGVTLACEHGAIAKCALWGYAPWDVGSAEHAACTRMVRADYCGDGASWTRDGTPIAHADVATLDALAPAATFEAGWGEGGAVCVGASRWEVVGADGAAVLPACWASLPRCDDAAAAIALGALLVDRARPETISACR